MHPRQQSGRTQIKANTFETLIQHYQAFTPDTYTTSFQGAWLVSLPSYEQAIAGLTNTASGWAASTMSSVNVEKLNQCHMSFLTVTCFSKAVRRCFKKVAYQRTAYQPC